MNETDSKTTLREFREYFASRAWCSEETGRQAQIAESVEVSRGLVNDWITGRREPGTNEYLTLRAFLKRQRRRSRPAEEGEEESE